jgi:trk system potassium uptake protein TrkH
MLNEPLQPHHMPPRPSRQATPAQIIILGFLGIILAGALLLMLPVSSRMGVVTPFSDALLTATSATCVTGLVVHDTATYWSPFGHLVLLALIQTGGMGVDLAGWSPWLYPL